MIKPVLDWTTFDPSNPPEDLSGNDYLVLIVDYGYSPDDNTIPKYNIDVAQAYGSYLDNFWDTENDWKEGQVIHVIAYADIGCRVKVEWDKEADQGKIIGFEEV